MDINNKRILLTGAYGGIGTQLVQKLSALDCQLAISGRDQSRLSELAGRISITSKHPLIPLPADIGNPEQCATLISQATDQLEGMDILINLAGQQTFKPLSKLTSEEIEIQIGVNLQAPILLSRHALIQMQKQGHGKIVNIGSTFGSIAFANFSVYSATKFGLRGFSESLRRELAGTDIKITYVAPRATKTHMNSDAVYEMAKETGMNMDSPEKVADEIIHAIKNDKANHFIGFPEKLFARINAILPGFVDKALNKQNLLAQKYV